MDKKTRYLFKQPAGASSRHLGVETWTSRAVLCELCGKEWPKKSGRSDESYRLGYFLGLQFVDECCGAVLDILYEEFAETFIETFLKDFSENPLDPRFGFLLFDLSGILVKAHQKAKKISDETSALSEQVSAIKELAG